MGFKNMRLLFNFLLWVCLLFYWNESGAIQYNFGNDNIQFDVEYQMDDFLYLKMMEIRGVMESSWGRPFHDLSFKKIFKKAKKKGDKKSRLFLTYLFLDKWLKERYGDTYLSHFEEMELSVKDIQSIRFLLQERTESYEWDFIEGWNAFFSLNDSLHIPERKDLYLRKSLFHFLVAKEGEYTDFQFPWAFLITEMREQADFNTVSIKEAEDAILNLAENDYAPAQYLMGIMELKNKQTLSALEWFKKSYTNDFQESFCAILIGWLYVDLGNFSQAIPYLEEVAYKYHYDFLKPSLMNAYIEQDQMLLAVHAAKEIAENYTNFSLDISLDSMQFLSFMLFANQEAEEDLMESYIWWSRARQISEEKDTPLEDKYGHSAALEKQLSFFEIRAAEERSKRLHEPAKMYSQMETDLHNECEIIYH